MLASYDEAESKSINETLSSSAKEEWKIAIEEKIESMKTNHV